MLQIISVESFVDSKSIDKEEKVNFVSQKISFLHLLNLQVPCSVAFVLDHNTVAIVR